VEKYYRTFTQKKIKNGQIKIRELQEVKEPLKTIQRKIKTNILSKLPIHESAFGGVKKRDCILHAAKHLGKKFHFSTDIKKCFPSIKPIMVYNLFITYGFSPDVSRLLTLLTTYKNELPQGSPTSTYLENLIFYNIDILLNNLILKNNIIYTRFVDDMIFSSNKDFKEHTNEIISILRNNKFNISHNKTYYKLGKIPVTGVLVGNNYLRPLNEHINKLKNLEYNSSSYIGLDSFLSRIINTRKKNKSYA
jgi:RNA-directed DNA polymerase